MDDAMTTIKYVQLESADFLSDPDFQLMTSEERGIYCSVIFYMYLNDGKILNEPQRIKKLCNVDTDFEKSWRVVQKKFTEKNGYLTHKRVQKELAKAKKYFQTQRQAGLRGAEKRWAGHGDPNRPAIARPMANKVKESKGKVSKNKHLDFVFLTENDYSKLLEKFGETRTTELIEELNIGLGSKGYKYKSHYFTILSWAKRKVKNELAAKTKLFPIAGKVCGKEGCKLPAVYKDTSGSYDSFSCGEHMPTKVKETYK